MSRPTREGSGSSGTMPRRQTSEKHLLRAWENKLLGRAGFFHVSRQRDDAKLLHHAQVVCHRPVLHDPPISDTHDIDELHRHLLAGWGDAHELALMSTVKGLTRRDLLPFGHHVLYGEIRIREGLTKHGRELLDALTVRRHSRRGAMVYELGGANLIQGVDVASALHFVDEAAHLGLVLLGGHSVFPFLVGG